MKHLMLMGAVLLLLLGGCEATIGGTDGYAVEAIVFSEDGSRGSREGTPERLVVVKVFDQDTREHIPADDGGSGAYDLFGRGEWGHQADTGWRLLERYGGARPGNLAGGENARVPAVGVSRHHERTGQPIGNRLTLGQLGDHHHR